MFLAYAAASLVLVVLLGGLLVQAYREDAARQGEDQGRAQASVIDEMAVAPALDGADLSAGLTGSQRQRLQEATDLAIFHGSVLSLRLRSFRRSGCCNRSSSAPPGRRSACSSSTCRTTPSPRICGTR